MGRCEFELNGRGFMVRCECEGYDWEGVNGTV